MGNVANRAVYVAGTPYSGCISGPNRGFPALCSANETIVNVPHKVNPDLAAVDGDSNILNLNNASRRKNRLRKTKKTGTRVSRPKNIRRRSTDDDYF